MSHACFNAIRAGVERLRPGHEMEVCHEDLMGNYAPPPFRNADWIMENILGSSYEYGYRINPISGGVVFFRLARPLSPQSGLRSYVSADRRHLYTQRPDGLWEYTHS